MDEKQKLAAKVLLHRRLKNLQRIDEYRDIDLEFITFAEYQLFLDDKRTEGKYYQPDHWIDYTFPKGMAREPIVGVRATNAEEFCKWLSNSNSGNYRLPTPSEFDEYPTDSLTTWCKKEDIFSMKELKKEKKDLILKELENISTDFPLFINLNSGHVNVFVRPFIFAISFAIFGTHVHGHALLGIFNLANVFGFADLRALAYKLVCDIACVVDKNICDAMKEKNYQRAKKLIKCMQDESDIFKQRQGDLLSQLSIITTSETYLKAYKVWQEYSVKLTEYAWIGYCKLEQEEQQLSWWQRIRGHKIYDYDYDYNKEKQAILNLYWWLQITILREQGKLPAWEGIRIVRERK